ncbi:MAG: bifunctional 2-polyprenyl-6-hydroxyphenol methylase/3-demethylubiquinol 3-O-methyltransferase UbiG [Chromatiales bacterium]
MAPNIDSAELSKFDSTAPHWWDRDGPHRTLHDINPVRARYVLNRATVAGRRAVDVGCGGGLFSEVLAVAGADVTGIDASEDGLAVARLHATQAGHTIDYQRATAEELAARQSQGFDLVACLELLEHVPSPAGLVTACAGLVRGGGDVFFSTLNRTAAAYALGVLGAEYVLGLLPRGTHDYRRFIRPSELARWARAAGLEIADISGMTYNPFTRRGALTRSTAVNYLMHCRKPG